MHASLVEQSFVVAEDTEGGKVFFRSDDAVDIRSFMYLCVSPDIALTIRLIFYFISDAFAAVRFATGRFRFAH